MARSMLRQKKFTLNLGRRRATITYDLFIIYIECIVSLGKWSKMNEKLFYFLLDSFFFFFF